MADIKITYETLFDLLRREKSRNELQDLDNNFYKDVVEYLKNKSEMLNNSSSTISKAEQEKIKIQLKNINRILKELYEIREKKIIMLAINKVRTESNLIDTSKLLAQEKYFYEESVLLLEKYKKGILLKLINKELPDLGFSNYLAHSDHKNYVPENQDENNNEHVFLKEKDSELLSSSKTRDFDKEIKSQNNFSDSSSSDLNSKFVKVKFLTNLPKFMGLDKKIYGPYEKGNVEELPFEIAELLSKKGRIEII